MAKKHAKPQIATASKKREREVSPPKETKPNPQKMIKESKSFTEDDDEEDVHRPMEELENSDDSGESYDLDNDSQDSSLQGEEEEERDEEIRLMKAALAKARGSGRAPSEEEEEEEEDFENEDSDEEDDKDAPQSIQVDFGAFDMTDAHVEPIMYLIDQLIPDHMLEVDRDDFAALVRESPYTMVLKVSGEEDDDEEEEEEVHGFTTIVDVAHNYSKHIASLKPLVKLLKEDCWRTAAAGAHPVDLLLDLNHNEKNPSKAVWLISQQNKHTVPMELTQQMMEDMLNRLEESSNNNNKGGDSPVFASPSCMFVILAKLQKAVDAPVSLDSKKKTKSDGKEKDSNNNKSELFDISQHYLFWREEDEVLYHFRDTRVAALLYRCRAQYDGQPESERPLSVLFVISSPTVLRQALEAMKRKSTLKPEITYY